MRTVKFIASALRSRNNGGGRLLPCRSAPV
jgi:hypothetical protein